MADGSASGSSAPFAVPASTREVLIALDGLHCAACVERLKGTLWDRVERFDVDLATRTLLVTLPPDRAVLGRLLGELKRDGFQPRLLDDDSDPFASTRSRRRELAQIGVAAIAAMQVMMLAWPTYFGTVPDPDVAGLLRWGQLLIAGPSLAWCAWPFLAAAVRALRGRRLSMDVPVAASVVIAFLVSAFRTWTGEGILYFDAATMFVSFLLIGRHLESSTRAMAGERLRQLASDAVPTAQRRVDGAWVTVPVARLSAGDRIRVMPGEVVPVDGTLQGAAELDESLLTGESRPVVRRMGDAALAGSLNVSRAPIEVLATRTGAQTWRSGIARLLVRAQAQRPRTQEIADRVAAHFTFVVLLLAGAGGAWAARHGVDAGLGVVLAVLVASCPCALSLSVPAALASATSRLAARGILVARADRLLRLADVDTALFDKTGTLTAPELSVFRVETAGIIDRKQCLRIAAALEAGVVHPIARALRPFAEGQIAVEVEVEPGRGVVGTVDGQRYRLVADDVPHHDGLTWILLATDDRRLASIGLGAAVREDAPATVLDLEQDGVEVRLVTGDAPEPAAAVANATGIERVASRQRPEEKLALLKDLQAQGRVVLAVGDGVNDAPYLSAADVSIAMASGSAVTQARADLLLVGERLEAIVFARTVARAARRRIVENLVWAAAYNLSVIPLALSGHFPAWIGAAGMSLSSLVVVFNALRLPRGESR